MSIKKVISTLLIVLAYGLQAQQHVDPAYIKVTEERASKIVKTLKLSDESKAQAVIAVIAKQYQNLSAIHDGRDAKIKALKEGHLDKEKLASKTDKLKTKSGKSINKLHKAYIKALAKHLNRDKIDAVKDGMTYGVLPITYAGYQDMLPNLTEEQKQYIYKNLVEARELAMDGGSSKEKHHWFGQYKGRINNYLSSQGYDLHKESLAWQERLKQKKTAK